MTATVRATAIPPGPSLRRRRRRPNWPALGLLGLVVAACAFLLVRVVAGGGPSPATFVDEDIHPLVVRSNALADDLRQLLGTSQEIDRPDLEARLGRLAREARALVAAGGRLTPPEPLAEATGQFVAALRARADGFRGFAEALMTGLEREDNMAALADALAPAGRSFVAGDLVYGYFAAGAERVLGGTAEIPASVYFTDPASMDRVALQAWVAGLMGSPAGTVRREVSVVTVAVTPHPVGTQGGVATIVASESFKVAVTVKNSGDDVERDLPVKATLLNESATDPQTRIVEIGRLEPGGSQTVTVEGLTPDPAETNRLRVSVGPLPGEDATKDNVEGLTFVFKA